MAYKETRVKTTLPGARPAAVCLAAIAAIVVAAMASLSWVALIQAERMLTYESLRRAESVGRALAASLDRAAELEIPLAKIPGINETLDQVRAQHASVSRISLLISGEERFAARAPGIEGSSEALVEQVPIKMAGGTTELLEVAVDPRFIGKVFSELALDFVVILIVAGFITLELIYFLAGPMVVSPLRQLSASIQRLCSTSLAGPIAANYPGTLRTMALAIRRRQDHLLNLYSQSRRLLREQLKQRRMQPSLEPARDEALRSHVQQLREIRGRFGLAMTAAREIVADPASALGRMRAPFFLVLLAEDLSRSFLPIYAGSMEVGAFDVSPKLIAGLPIFLFMLIVAISQPVLGGWSERSGRRRAFLVGAMVAVAAHFLTAQATTLAELLVWRVCAGAAWAIAFVAAQGIVLDHTDKSTRARGLAGFVTVIMVSLACGPSVGGLLADSIGYRATFVVAGAVAAIGLIVAWRSLPADLPKAPTVKAQTSPTSSMLSKIEAATPVAAGGHALTNWRFLGLLVLAAIPAKLILIAYCYYLIPLYLTASGNSAAMAGRIIMIYSVVMVVVVPIASSWIAEVHQRTGSASYAWFVAAGIALSGLAAAAMFIPGEIAASAVLVAVLGVAQAISISPQAAMVPELARDEIARQGEAVVYGYYRLVERIGSAIGPIIAAAMLQLVSFRQAFILLGALVFLCGVCFAILYARPPRADANRHGKLETSP
jgi:MFS family permease